MTAISQDLEVKLYQVLGKKITLKQFEQWLYTYDTLESDDPNLYFELISFDYSSKDNLKDFYHRFDCYIDYSKFEAEQMIGYLQSIIEKSDDCGCAIWMIYELYCDGYDFFRRLGLKYGLCLINLPNLSSDESRAVIDKLYPDIIEDAKLALNWFKNKKIIFKNGKNDWGEFKYDDLRTSLERQQGDLLEAPLTDYQSQE
ncbi:MAG: hypothetical protein Q4P13_00840 [Psychrobacter sp.]|nr:hypothetical protein [Psychrobacter sp.]